MGPDGGVLAHEGAVDQRLILKEGVERAEDVALVVVPPQRVVLGSHLGSRAGNLLIVLDLVHVLLVLPGVKFDS